VKLARQRRGVAPQMLGRYPDFDVLDTVETWDPVTRRAVLARLEPPGPLRFFTAAEEATLRSLCDMLSGQHEDPRVPVAEMVDTKLHEGRLDGYQHEDMPDDRDTWRLALRGVDEVAERRWGRPFAELDLDARRGICQDFAEGLLSGGVWEQLDCKRAFGVVMRGVAAEFYSHPWAWNEIGFGGPAYPRGFGRFGTLSAREPFETDQAYAEDPVRDVESRHE
jgi:Gluconate 2-dehydrogenase subunit 3